MTASATSVGTPWAALAGVRVVSGSVTIPLYGTWTADLTLATDASVMTQPVLTIGNLQLQGAVVRQDVFAGLRQVRLIGGFGGWPSQVAAKAYTMPSGALLPLSMLLGDLAGEVGERMAPVTGQAGNQYVREAASAQRSLEFLSGGQWWIDPKGLTHVGPRTPTAIQSPLQVIHYDGGRGAAQVSTEDPASWLPGASFTSPTVPTPLTISLVTHTLTSSGAARIDVLTTPGTTPVDRIIAAFQALVRTELPEQKFLGTYEYSVASSDGSTVDATPVDTSAGLPEITRVTLRAGLAGSSSKPSPGSVLGVGFLNGDPQKPFVAGGFDSTMAQDIALGAASATAAAVASIVNTCMANIKTWLSAHTHPYLNVATPSNTSAAALTPPVTPDVSAQIVRVK